MLTTLMWIAGGAGLLIGAAVAALFFFLILGKWYVGSLNTYKLPDEEQPYYFLEISQGHADDMRKAHFVVLRVKKEIRK